MLEYFLDSNSDFHFDSTTEGAITCDALSICYPGYEQKELQHLLSSLLFDLNLYVYFIDSDVYTVKILDKIKDFKGSFGKNGLPNLNKSKFLGRKISTPLGNYYFDVAKVVDINDGELYKIFRLIRSYGRAFIVASFNEVSLGEHNVLMDFLEMNYFHHRQEVKSFKKFVQFCIEQQFFCIVLGEDHDQTNVLTIMGDSLDRLINRIQNFAPRILDKDVRMKKQDLKNKGYYTFVNVPI